MPRQRKRRRCRGHAGDRVFKPRSIPMHALDEIHLDLSELEVLRLCDLEQCDQEQAGRRMGISRGTVQRLLSTGRAKVVEALVQSRALIIEPGAEHEDLYPDRR